jgi:hypothetical protein
MGVLAIFQQVLNLQAIHERAYKKISGSVLPEEEVADPVELPAACLTQPDTLQQRDIFFWQDDI